MDQDRVTLLVMVALLHDVGKLLERGEIFSEVHEFFHREIFQGAAMEEKITIHNHEGVRLP